MRIQYRYLTFDSHLKSIGPIRKILDQYNIDYNYKEDPDCVIPTFIHTLEFFLYEDQSYFNAVKKDIEKFKIDAHIGTEYEKKDIENAEWFIVSTGEYQYPLPDNDFGYLKATFNLDQYCEICGIGKVQNAPYRLKEPKQYNNQFWGLHWDFDAIFVRSTARDLLEKEQVKSIRFTQPVLHKKNIPIKDFYQLHMDAILPKAFDHYNTKTLHCKIDNEEGNNDPKLAYCGRIKYHHPMIGGYCFDKNVFGKDEDIIQSNEYFGSGGMAHRLQFFSKRLKNIIEKNKLKGLKFIPVMHQQFKR